MKWSSPIKSLPYIFLILLLSIVVIPWFKGDHLIMGVDLYFPQERINFFNVSLSAWDYRSLGSDNFRMLAELVPYSLFLAITEYLEISLPMTQKIWFYFLMASGGLSMFYLALIATRLITGSQKYFVSFLASILYMGNPLAAYIYSSLMYLWAIYALLPLKLAFFIKGIVERRGWVYVFWVCLGWLLISGSLYVNPKFLILDLLAPLLFLVYYVGIINRKAPERKKAVKFSLQFFGTLFLFFSFWLIPAFIGIAENFKQSEIAYDYLGDRPRVSTFQLNSAANLVDASQLKGMWAAKNGWRGERYYFWTDWLDNPISRCLSFLIVVVSLFPLFGKQRPPPSHYYFYLLFLVSVVGMNGASDGAPVWNLFNYINIFLARHLPLFAEVFSLPYFMFGLYAATALPVIFALGVYKIDENFSFTQKKKVLLISMTLVGLFFLVKPIWTGEIMRKHTPLFRSSIYKVPNYYYEASEFFNQKKLLTRFFPIPYSSQGYMANDWDTGFLGVSIIHLLQDSMILGLNNVSLLTEKAVNENVLGKYNRLLSFQGVKYVLFSDDSNWHYFVGHPWYRSQSPEKYKSMLDRIFKKDNKIEFERLHFHQVSDANFLPLIYIPKEIEVFQNSMEDWFVADSNEKVSTASAVYFDRSRSEQEKDEDHSRPYDPLESIPASLSQAPNVEFKKINPNKYRVRIHKASETFPLVFSSLFNFGWNVYFGDNFKQKGSSGILESYRIFKGNLNDQAIKGEVLNLLEKGQVSTLGDGREKKVTGMEWKNGNKVWKPVENFSVDFISKNFNGTVQNNNLPNGTFSETWSKSPVIKRQDHVRVNGYANSWTVDPNSICKENSACILNMDGSYDFELILEFRGQKVYYFGLFITGMTILTGLIYSIFRKRFKKTVENRATLPITGG